MSSEAEFLSLACNAVVAVLVANYALSDMPNVLLMIANVVVIMMVILIPLSFILKIKPSQAEK